MQGHRRLRLWGSQSGFTLIELLGVMVIVLLLSLVAVSVFINITDTTRRSASAGKLTEVEKALERYQVDKGYYPTTLAELVTEGYIRAPSGSGDAVRFSSLASPWFDATAGRYFYYDVPQEQFPKQFLLVDPSPQACNQAPVFCVPHPATSQPPGFDPTLVRNLNGGWRSSGNWN